MAKSTYYFEINKIDVVEFKNKDVMIEIKSIFEQNKGRYGVRRVHKELVNYGYKINHKRVQRLMHNRVCLENARRKNTIPTKVKSGELLTIS